LSDVALATSPRTNLLSSIKLEATAVIMLVLLSGGMLNEHLRVGGETSRGLNQVLLLPIYGSLALLALYRASSSALLLIRSPLTALLLIIPFASVLWSASAGQSASRTIAFGLASATAIYVADRFTLRDTLRMIAIGVGVAAVLNLLYTLAAPGSGIMQDGHAGAWRGIYSQKNGLARLMVLGFISCAALVLSSRGVSRLLASMGATLCLLLVFLSTSKTALVVIAVVGVGVGFVHLLRARGLLLVVVSLLITLATGLSLLLLALYAEDGAALLGRDLSLSGRTIVWSASVAELASRPLLGFGYGAFWTGWNGPGATVWAQVGWDPGDSHNGFLDAALDFGIVGVSLLILHVSVTLVMAVRWARSSSAVPLWPIAFVLFFVLYNLTESSTFRPTNVLWLLYPILSLQLVGSMRQQGAKPSSASGAVD
jgi:exopolysaccharide production protein ExoQ